MKNQLKLREWGLEGTERYYYFRFGKGAENVPDGFFGVATACLIPVRKRLSPERVTVIYARGVSFCSPRDQFVKKTGRAIALGRAIQAIENQSSSNHVPEKVWAGIMKQAFGWTHLSTWDAHLTEYENKLFREKDSLNGEEGGNKNQPGCQMFRMRATQNGLCLKCITKKITEGGKMEI